MKFRKKPVVVEAKQWHGMGDDPDVVPFVDESHLIRTGERCEECNALIITHGQIKTLEGWHIVCPDDWIITGVKGERYPCKPGIFMMTYEVAKDRPMIFIDLLTHEQKQAGYFVSQDEDFIYLFHERNSEAKCIANFPYESARVKEIRDTAQEHFSGIER